MTHMYVLLSIFVQLTKYSNKPGFQKCTSGSCLSRSFYRLDTPLFPNQQRQSTDPKPHDRFNTSTVTYVATHLQMKLFFLMTCSYYWVPTCHNFWHNLFLFHTHHMVRWINNKFPQKHLRTGGTVFYNLDVLQPN